MSRKRTWGEVNDEATSSSSPATPGALQCDRQREERALAACGSRAMHPTDRQNRVSPAEQRDSFDNMLEPTGPCHADRLPAELLQVVLSQLPLRQLFGVQRVSRRWQDAVLDLLRRRQKLYVGWIPDSTLLHLLRRMPALRVLRTLSCSDKVLDIVATHCKHLVKIHFGGGNFSEESMRKLCVACPSLEIVVGCLNEGSLRVLLRHLSALRELVVQSDFVTGQCFSLLPGSLQRLSVSDRGNLRSDSLQHVGARCPQLRQLNVSGLPQVRSEDLAAALAGCSQLQRLMACELRQPMERCLPPAGLPALKQLNVSWAAGVTDNTLKRLPDLLPSLQTLSMRHCRSVSEKGLYHLRRCEQLLSLNLSHVPCVTDAVLDQLHGMQLKELILSDGYDILRVSNEGLSRLVVACPSLTRLGVSYLRGLTPGLVNLLLRVLPNSRDVSLYVRETLWQPMPPPQLPPSSPVRLLQIEDPLSDERDVDFYR